MMKKLLTLGCLASGLAVAQGFDMRGLKKRNTEYLKNSNQRQMKPFTVERRDAARRHVLEAGLEDTAQNVAAAHRHLSYFNESKWVEAESWDDPQLTNDMSYNASACPGMELYGPFGNQYICPGQQGVDCMTGSDPFAKMDEQGRSMETDGTWYVMPTAMRGNWDEADYWTIPFSMGKFINEYEDMCEAGDAFNTVTFPSCIEKGLDLPYATICAFNRLYTLDYAALWYMWLAWYGYKDSATLVTKAANIETDGMEATTFLYQSRIFVPSAAGAKRKLLQDASGDATADEVEAMPSVRILATAAKGGDLETLQNMLDSSALGGSPTLVQPPPAPAMTDLCVGNCTNATATA